MHTKKHNGISFQCVISVSTDLTIWFWTMKEIQVCENVFSTSSLVPVQNQNVFLSLVQIMYNVYYLKREKVWLAIIKKLNTFFFVNSWNYCLAHHMISPIFSPISRNWMLLFTLTVHFWRNFVLRCLWWCWEMHFGAPSRFRKGHLIPIDKISRKQKMNEHFVKKTGRFVN
jgi:hypothetical protein